MNPKKFTLLYIIFDISTAVFTWICFFIYRKYHIDNFLFSFFTDYVLMDKKFWIGIIFYPVFWIILYAFIGFYDKVYRKSRLKELSLSIFSTFIGVILIFFFFILDDQVNIYSDYNRYFIILLSLHFFTSYIPRVCITSNIISKIRNGIIGFNTLIIGSDSIALKTYHAVIKHNENLKKYMLGYVGLSDIENQDLSQELKCLGMVEQLAEIVKEFQIQEIIIALPNAQRKHIETVLTMICDQDILLKVLPQTEDYFLGFVRTSQVIFEPLIDIPTAYQAVWQRHLKRSIDIIVSLTAIIILSPVYLILALGVKFSSEGNIFYFQKRIGKGGKPFNIIKFRSMYCNAETDTPLLASKNDQRITSFGKFMRKSRLDETPQFINVLKGEMSLVGPRPERQYFIDQIIVKAPYYKLLLAIKPGITSWGQVKYGYAENIDQMIERLRWDLLYLENMNFQMDLKILIYTVLIVLKGAGK
jgi:exopolysaccharide biosynthesis polyprenyl glycosylphosphotransferase